MIAPALREEDLPHYTYDDYTQWQGKWELIRGLPFAMTPAPAIRHQRICGQIDWQLRGLLKDCLRCEVLWPVDWPIAEDTVVQPDVLVVCKEKEGENIGVERLEKTPVLVFEVISPATSRKDRVIKYQLYEEAGVKYYCIVEPDSDGAVVFSLQRQKYNPAEEFNDGRMPFDLGPCRIAFDFNKIFA